MLCGLLVLELHLPPVALSTFSPLLMFQHPTELLLQSICSKVKSLRIQDSDIRVLKQPREPTEQATFCDCTGHVYMKSACVGVCVHS